MRTRCLILIVIATLFACPASACVQEVVKHWNSSADGTVLGTRVLSGGSSYGVDYNSGWLRCFVNSHNSEVCFFLMQVSDLAPGDLVHFDILASGYLTQASYRGYWGLTGESLESHVQQAFSQELLGRQSPYVVGWNPVTLTVPEGMSSIIVGISVESGGSTGFGYVEKMSTIVRTYATITAPGGLVQNEAQSMGGVKALFR